MDAARNLAADPALVQAKYQRMLEHQKEWSSDRGAALAIRRALEQADSSAIYECDDKCGSFWCKLPVDPSGRHDKAAAKAVYNFAVQANVVAGAQGVCGLRLQTPRCEPAMQVPRAEVVAMASNVAVVLHHHLHRRRW